MPVNAFATFDAKQKAEAAKVSTYLSSLQTLVGNFIQVGPDGTKTKGEFYIQKPGKVRFEYDAPAPIEIIADGSSLVVRDRNLATQDVYPLSQTPLRYLLSNRIDLMKDTNVVNVIADDIFITVTIEEKQALVGTSRLMLMIGAKDGQLKQWTVTDPQGYDTTVAVYNLDTTKKLDPEPVQDRLHQLRRPRRVKSRRKLVDGAAGVKRRMIVRAVSPESGATGRLIRQHDADLMRFSLTTWNINSVRLRIDLVAKFIKSVRPDVLCLQETKCLDDAFPLKRFRRLGYEHVALNGQKGYHGVAVSRGCRSIPPISAPSATKSIPATSAWRSARRRGSQRRWCCTISMFPRAATFPIPRSIRNSSTSCSFSMR